MHNSTLKRSIQYNTHIVRTLILLGSHSECYNEGPVYCEPKPFKGSAELTRIISHCPYPYLYFVSVLYSSDVKEMVDKLNVKSLDSKLNMIVYAS